MRWVCQHIGAKGEGQGEGKGEGEEAKGEDGDEGGRMGAGERVRTHASAGQGAVRRCQWGEDEG